IYIPIYGSVTDLPDTYKTCGRITGFSKDAAWWAFNRLGTITAKRWGDMHKVVDEVWNPLQTSYFQQQKKIEKKALSLLKNEGKSAAINYLTRYTNDCGIEVVEKAWLTGDLIWPTFDGRW
ncbi:MAG TPA: hypothetical protein P5215_01310, partial [Bacteroidales bacterium]|nr:hypothetical protein [Bacteroidales bacterium]